MADAMTLKVVPDQATLDELARVVRELRASTGRSMFDALTYAGVKVAQSGRAASKLGKSKRESIDNPEFKQARGSFAWARRQQRMGKAIPAEAQAALNDLNSISPFLIVKHRQGGQPPLMLPSYEKKDPRRVIHHASTIPIGGRGLAKKTFNIMAAKMASSAGREKFSSRGSQYRISRYKERYGETSGAFVARLINELTYLETAYPGITNLALAKGTSALRRELERGVAGNVRRANR